jgi:hypothetical protein
MNKRIRVGDRVRFSNSKATVIGYQPATRLRDGTTATDGAVDILYDNGDTDRVGEATFSACAKVVRS